MTYTESNEMLNQWLSTGVLRNPRVPWASAKGSTAGQQK